MTGGGPVKVPGSIEKDCPGAGIEIRGCDVVREIAVDVELPIARADIQGPGIDG